MKINVDNNNENDDDDEEQQYLNECGREEIRTDLNIDELLRHPPPDYRKVCPPTYEESFYYPQVKIKILPDDDYNMDEYKIVEEEKKKKIEEDKLKKDMLKEENLKKDKNV